MFKTISDIQQSNFQRKYIIFIMELQQLWFKQLFKSSKVFKCVADCFANSVFSKGNRQLCYRLKNLSG
ncbi:MAG: hypothetical protein A2X05_08380 [Bacteroidetes bacterium GWE2_41_25]|nr:MAG: hypothetical protein A2X03_06880 [Bacteroidetes bacterium GWA2_40_15]OFX91270.1 MAG: hypothetical protein A2X06_01525 [Bacteroidetes bacterium GWC2_40_22]OFX92939.1 MAG: hypothetical protein A2X05_08380 [Bacteroidetes bacterium GWE2_41_25]OFY61362.1 MAG: hypothetical protein A2X04_09290 [Bacteroidetes bacterium GWF2_41_9]HAM10448.1 hypothetical protein [Bacteroidales bacterium]